MSIFNRPLFRPSILVELNPETRQIVVKGCIDDTITAIHMLTDAIQIVLKRFDVANAVAHTNGEGKSN